MRGEAVVRIETDAPQDLRPIAERLAAGGIPAYEADVPFAWRPLIARGIRASLALDGAPREPTRAEAGVDVVFDDPDLAPADWTPALTVLSLDIETDPRATRVLSVGLAGCGAAEVLVVGAPAPDDPPETRCVPDERTLLERTAARIRELDPDVLTGWNVIDFDFAVLARRAEALSVPFEFGRGPGALRMRPAGGWWRGHTASVPGRVVLDGVDLLRGSFIKMERYGLDFVAKTVLGEGKTIHGSSRAGEILRQYREERASFIRYNLTDARLVLEILAKLHLVELTVERCRLTGLAPDRAGGSIAAFDMLYLTELARRGIVAPSVAAGAEAEPTAGGHVLEPRTGLHENVLVFDFRSLYPSIIRTFQIDPLGLVDGADDGGDVIVAPNGARFRRAQGILPSLLDALFPRREEARRAGDTVTAQAVKILMNSFYGVLGTTACRFYDPRLANAITGFGRELLLWTKARCEAHGHAVLYGDTDSLFVVAGADDAAEARARGAALCTTLNAELAEHVAATWRVTSRLELRFEKLYERLLLPPMRHGTGGARKRYAGLVRGAAGPEVEFTGMEVVRRDWTDLARTVQRELYRRLFLGEPVDAYLAEVVRAVRDGAWDDRVVYRKALRKDLDEYTATTPPHVAAARKAGEREGSLVAYVVTLAGPEPAGEVRSPIDREHYVQKQVRPVAEPVLAALGLEFDRVVGDDRQGRLF